VSDGRTVQFGVFVTPSRTDVAMVWDQVSVAEDSGFDYVSIQDHPYEPNFLDSLALIGLLLGRTSTLRFMPNVANLPLRPPAMLAKAAATLDALSGGRFELGLGGGSLWARIAALGGPALSPGEVVAATDEAMTVIRALWTPGQVATVRGRHYTLTGVETGPAPSHDIGIWLGARGPRMLELLGRRADGWIAPVSTNFETKAAAQDRIDAAARAAGRDPGGIRRVIQLIGQVTDHTTTTGRPRSGPGTQPIRATPDVWATIVAEFVREERFDTVNFLPEDRDTRQLVRFATEVIPRARALAAAG
jgi:alkanesulfonate monooxygenase SsuD/methylene tetrahydromethanopterin reductase-like flavin-dependent oxidoreductase (luciferase family)